jgi:hypothetical protein
VLAVWIVFGRACGFGFVDFDDSDYVRFVSARPVGMEWENVRWAFTTFTFSNWHPLTWISYLLDRAWFSTAAGGMHAENIFIHAINSALLFLVMEKSTRRMWASAMVAGLFALHPMHVESVVWIAERKDVLSMFFLLLSWLVYAGYARRPTGVKYLLIFVFFAASLGSKAMGVTFPVLLLLWDIWPLGRRGMGRLLLEKVPLLLLSAVVCVLTIEAQRSGNSLSSLAGVSLGDRLGNAAAGYLGYLGKLLMPVNLAVFYPMRPLVPAVVAAAIVFVIGASAAALRLQKRAPYLAFGWFWFLLSLLPMLGVVQVGWQAMADRYSYLPSIGIFVIVVWGVSEFAAARRGIVVGLGIVVLTTCGLLTWIQVGYWKDASTLFEHALAVTDQNWLAHFHLGNVAAGRGDYGAAAAEYSETIAINPNYSEAYCNLGNCIYVVDPEKSIPLYVKAIELQPRDAKWYINLGNAYLSLGRVKEAGNEYREATRLDPGSELAREGVEASERRMHRQ